MTKTRCLNLILASLVLICAPSLANVAVIVNPANNSAISTEDIKSLYSGRQKSFANGKAAIVLSLEENNPTRSAFNNNVLGKSDAQVKAYWSKLVFTGKGTPPNEISTSEMLQLVADNPNTIGFIDAGSVTDAVKVVAKF